MKINAAEPRETSAYLYVTVQFWLGGDRNLGGESEYVQRECPPTPTVLDT